MTALFVFTETPCELSLHLKDTSVVEGQSATFNLILTKPRNVVWIKESDPVTDSKHFQMTVSEGGMEHFLTIPVTSLEDDGEFTAQINDSQYGLKSSSCRLSVKGIKQMDFLMNTDRNLLFNQTLVL